ncbi:MAG TPA: glycosyltransferase family 4 protein [Candidatus Nanopelagicaceae bacterium]|nr:glycosyltransferase family 4 protein [Candidatus Nanopelagicaceae bacterium]
MSSQPRVMLVIADSSRTGGPEHVFTLARQLLAASWAPLVVCPEGPLQERCSEAGIAHLPLIMSGTGLAAAPIRLRQMVRHHDVDLVHSHALRAGMVLRRARVPNPFVHTHHLDGWFTASRLRTRLHRRELRQVAASADRQIAVSASVLDFLRDEVGLDPGRLRLVVNGIDPLRARLRPAPAGFRVGTLARLTPAKGIDLAVMALAAPAGRNLSLQVGGTGPELAPLIDLAASLGVADRVHFVGDVVDRQQFFEGCDVVWVPSREEPFGLVACEAMSAGVPVVASRVGGLPEIIEAPHAGILVSPANPAALASVTAALLADPERYRRLSLAGPERVLKHFSAQRMAALTRGVYREILR